MLPLPLHPELGGEEGHYQTVWRRSTAVNEFGMALFVPKPEPSSAHGGSGRHTIKIDHDPPSPVAVRFEPEDANKCERQAGRQLYVMRDDRRPAGRGTGSPSSRRTPLEELPPLCSGFSPPSNFWVSVHGWFALWFANFVGV